MDRFAEQRRYAEQNRVEQKQSTATDDADRCPNCGAVWEADDLFCGECGLVRSAPQEMTLEQMRQQVREHPKFREVVRLSQELEELEAYILAADEADKAPPDDPVLAEASRALVEKYRNLLSDFREPPPEPAKKSPDKSSAPTPTPSKPKHTFSFNLQVSSKEEALAAYHAKMDEMKAAISAIVPDPGMTPQMQRMFFTAVKVEVMTQTKAKVKIGWQCNAYGCIHDQPNECAEPFKGGKWLFEERLVTTSTWVRPS